MRRASWTIGLMVFLLAMGATGASGEGTATEGETWDHRHMQTRYRSVLSAESRRTDVSGSDRYGRIATPPTETEKAKDEAGDLATVWTQRPWEPGGPRVRAQEDAEVDRWCDDLGKTHGTVFF